jgi:lysozyme-like protein
MAKLSREEIATVARNAGFSGDDLNIAVAVALAESSGDPTRHNATPPDNSYGLWQINMLGAMGPARRTKYGLKSNDELYSPSTNARVAYAIFKESGWKPWTTYTRGTYKQYMTGDDSNGATPETAPAGANPINGIGDAINAFGATIFKGFANIAGIAVAIVLLILGVVLLSRNALPTGKVLKVAKGLAK